MRPSRTDNAAGPPDRAAVVQYDRPKQARHPRGECSSAALRPGQRPTQLALVMPRAPIVTRAPSDWDRPLGQEQSNMRRWQQTWEGGKHTLHGGAIVRKRVDSSVVESGSSMTTANVCTQQKGTNDSGLIWEFAAAFLLDTLCCSIFC